MAVVQLLFPQHYRSVRAALLGQRPREAAPLEGATFTDANITGDGEYTVTLDGFIISDNLECLSYENINTGYSWSDHDPVYLKFKLK